MIQSKEAHVLYICRYAVISITCERMSTTKWYMVTLIIILLRCAYMK